ncbi:MAG: nucleoside-diphosphate kinase [Bryobacteraceae bacterium]|nr:nucleoside-diphosphate kinase [Bryobacterales bacterium]MEB2361733.1 nucleoside-diphosphate kinase [Bryobacterales bacterium]NUN03186.1 nucleoside-diphosphate kinase [Bryobacteraceae bacterium]
MVERTLGIIKPDAVSAGHTGRILAMIEEARFRIAGMKMVRLRTEQARGFYDVHRSKPFFPNLVSFMTEGPIVVLVLEHEDAIRRWRDVMGATNPTNAAEGTIRKKFGTNIERNCVHGSDSPETAAVEVAFFFSAAELL